MKCPINKNVKSNRITGIVCLAGMTILCVVLFNLGGDDFYLKLAVLIMFSVYTLLIIAFFILCWYDSAIIELSPKGVIITRGKKICFERRWDEIKDVGRVNYKYGRVRELLYMSTRVLTEDEKDGLRFRKCIQKDLFFTTPNDELLNYALARMNTATEETTDGTIETKNNVIVNDMFKYNVDKKRGSMELYITLAVMSVLITVSTAFMFMPTLGRIEGNISFFIILGMIFNTVLAAVLYFEMWRISNLYYSQLIYDGETVKVSNRNQKTLCEFYMNSIRRIGTVDDGKRRYIYFAEKTIPNADIKTVRNLYKNKEILYCEYDKVFFEHLRFQHPEKTI